MASVVLLLGGNIGDTRSYFEKAKELIVESIGNISDQSSLYRSAAWGKTDQPDFLNQVIVVKTKLKPRELLNSVQQIEMTIGRVREIKWGERKIDIDILFYDDLEIQETDLIVPHPFIQERKFTLIPLAEVLGNFIHPVTKITINQMLKRCKDPLSVKKTD